MTLSELEEEIVLFGEKHKGKKFSEAWKDQEWVGFMAARYSQSMNPQHQKFLKYVEMMVEYHEHHQLPVTETITANTSTVPVHPMTPGALMAKAKPRPKPYAAHTMAECPLPTSEGGEEDWELGSVMYQSESMIAQNLSESPEFQAMSQRLLHMENALQRVIGHLERQTDQNQEHQ